MSERKPRTEAERSQAAYTWLSPAECGKRAGVCADTIIAAVDAGELVAMNVAKPDAKRRTLKVRPEWLNEWMQSRTLNRDAA